MESLGDDVDIFSLHSGCCQASGVIWQRDKASQKPQRKPWKPFGFWACQTYPGPLHSGDGLCWPSDHPRGCLMLLVLSVGPPCLELFFAFCVPHHTFKILRSLKSLKLVICTLKTCNYGAADVMFTCRCCVDIYRMWAGFGGGGCSEWGGGVIFASKVTEVSPQLCI